MRVDIAPERPRVEVALKDGSVAILFPLAPEDRPYLVQGLDELSLESRFTRFGQGRQRLSESEWAYLTEIDQRAHVAWVAVVDGHGAGVGRYILIPESDCAEVAVTVLDDFQGRGIGTALFLALVAVARAEGVGELCFEVIPSNVKVRAIMQLVGASVSVTDGLMEGRVDPRAVDGIPNEDAAVEAMRRYRAQSA
jgi:GNAT superfamily N-acetyltransferase